MNHADDPNFGFQSENEAVALRDIAAGEELTCDYNVFFENGFEFLGDRLKRGFQLAGARLVAG